MKWMVAVQTQPLRPRKTKAWELRSKSDGSVLGTVNWFTSWRKYAFFPTLASDTVFDADCLQDIVDFCRQQTKEHNDGLKANRKAAG